MKNIIIAILVVLVLVLGFLFFTQKKSNVSYEPRPETEPATVRPTTNNTTNTYPVQNNTTTTNTSNQTQTTSGYSNTNTTVSLENIETPLFIKSIYQKNGKWWADVDYVTYDSGNYINQNPLIRSLQFSLNFKSTGIGADCFDGGVPNGPETYKNFLDPSQYSNAGYYYDMYQTRGLFIENAIIKDSQIIEFNFSTSCVN